MTDLDPGFERFAAAVSGIFDPAARFAEAVSGGLNRPAAQAGRCEEVKLHAERRGSDGVLLRIEDAACGRAVEAVLDTAACRDLARYLNSAR